MKKKTSWNKRARVLSCAVMAAMLMMGLAACGDAKTDAPETTQESTQESTPESTQESTPESTPETTQESVPESVPETTTDQSVDVTQEVIFGQVTAIEDKTITLAEAEQPEDSMQKPEDGAAPDKQENEGETQPDQDGAQKPDGTEDGAPELALTGEVKKIMVDDSTLFTINGKEGTISDLAVNDTVTVTMEGDKVISVVSGLSSPADGQ